MNNQKKVDWSTCWLTEVQDPDEKMQPILADNGQYDQLVQSLGLVHSGNLKATRLVRCTTDFGWKKVKTCWFGSTNGCDSGFLHRMLRLAKGTTKLKTSWWLARCLDWSKWFAISSLLLLQSQFQFYAWGWKHVNRLTNLDVRKLHAHLLTMSGAALTACWMVGYTLGADSMVAVN